jgi:hypothetical protein
VSKLTSLPPLIRSAIGHHIPGGAMLKKISFIFVLCCSMSIASNAADLQSVKPVELSNPTDVNDIKKLNDSVDALSNKVMECVKKKAAPPNECYCRYPKELAQLKDTYKKTLQQHPSWYDQVIFWWRDTKHDYSYNLSLQGLRMQLEKKCPTHPSSETR